MKTIGWMAALLLVAPAVNAEDWVIYGLRGNVTTSDSDAAKVGDEWTAQFKVRYDAPAYYSDEYSTHYECIDDLKTTVGGRTYARTDPWEFAIDPHGAVGFSEASIGNDGELSLGFLPVDPGTDSLESARDLDNPEKWSLKRWGMGIWDSTWEGVRQFSSFAGDVVQVWTVDQWKTGQKTTGPGYSDGTIKDGYPPGSDM